MTRELFDFTAGIALVLYIVAFFITVLLWLAGKLSKTRLGQILLGVHAINTLGLSFSGYYPEAIFTSAFLIYWGFHYDKWREEEKAEKAEFEAERKDIAEQMKTPVLMKEWTRAVDRMSGYQFLTNYDNKVVEVRGSIVSISKGTPFSREGVVYEKPICVTICVRSKKYNIYCDFYIERSSFFKETKLDEAQKQHGDNDGMTDEFLLDALVGQEMTIHGQWTYTVRRFVFRHFMILSEYRFTED